MKKYSLLVTILLVVALLAMTTPAFAADKGPTGEKISLYFGGSMEFTSGVPFYIGHGWVQTSADGAIGVFDFALDVDGVLQKEDFKMFSAVSGDPDLLNRIWVYNFPNGMTGEHTFTGHWFAPCQYAVDFLDYPGPCATPNEKVETNTKTLIVTFIP